MTIEEFVAKPVTIRAIKWTGKNLQEIVQFTNGLGHMSNGHLVIETREGSSRAAIGDWIACGTQGEFYPIKPDVMEAKYLMITCPVEGCHEENCEHRA